jgi:hypothetical protein
MALNDFVASVAYRGGKRKNARFPERLYRNFQIVILTPKVEDNSEGECCDHACMGITEPKSWGVAPSS